MTIIIERDDETAIAQEKDLQEELERALTTIQRNNRDRELLLLVESLEELKSNDTQRLHKLTEETNGIAARMSLTIRKKDSDKKRVVLLLELIEEIELVREQTEALVKSCEGGNDLNKLCETFATIKRKLSDDRIRSALAARYSNYGSGEAVDSIKETLRSRLMGFMCSVNVSLTDNIDETMGSAFSMQRLFALIGEGEEGLRYLCDLVSAYTKGLIDKIIDGNSILDFRYAAKIDKIVEFGKGLASWCRLRSQARIREDLFGGEGASGRDANESANDHRAIAKSGNRRIAECISREVFAGINKTINLFRVERKVANVTAAVDLRDLDLIVSEISLIVMKVNECKHWSGAENFDTVAISALKSEYLMLEKKYQQDSIQAAVAMNTINNDSGLDDANSTTANMPATPTSTCMEDGFFLLKKTMLRSVAMQEASIVALIIESGRNCLSADLLPFLQRRTRQLFADPKTGDSIIVCVNDALIARTFLTKLTDELNGVCAGENTVFDQSRAVAKLATALNELESSVGAALDALIRTCYETIYSTQIKSKLAPVFVDLSIAKISGLMEKTIVPLLGELLEENRTGILLLVTKEIALHMERSFLRQSWSRAAVAAVMKDARRLSMLLASFTEMQSRELFIRTNQMLQILDCETRAEAIEMAGSDGTILTDAEVNTLVSLRTDWNK